MPQDNPVNSTTRIHLIEAARRLNTKPNFAFYSLEGQAEWWDQETGFTLLYEALDELAEAIVHPDRMSGFLLTKVEAVLFKIRGKGLSAVSPDDSELADCSAQGRSE